MISVVLLLKRKPGLTKAEFREHYENSHAKMAMRAFGHLVQSYTRNYVTSQGAHASTAGEGASGDTQYDVITVLTFKDSAAVAEMSRIVSAPAQFQAFIDDEEKFLNRAEKIAFSCDQLFSPTLFDAVC